MSCKDMRDKPSKMSASSDTNNASNKENDDKKTSSKSGCGCGSRY